MTQLPQPGQGMPNVMGQAPNPLAPAREINRVIRKALPDGRVLDFVYVLVTRMRQDMTYVTWELVQPPTLDCLCSAASPDDVVCCSNSECGKAICVRRHSWTCQACGLVFGSCCLSGVVVNRVRAIVCKNCEEKLTASCLARLFKGVRRMIWG